MWTAGNRERLRGRERGRGRSPGSLPIWGRGAGQTAFLQAVGAAIQLLEIYFFSFLLPPTPVTFFFKKLQTRHCNQQSERKEGTSGELLGGTDKGRQLPRVG